MNKTEFIDFKLSFEKIMNEVDRTVDSFPFESGTAYAAWLAQTFYYTQHTTRLLTLSAALMDFDRERIHRRMIQHAREEMSHERLALKDLKFFDLSLKNIPELSETKAFYQSQYFWIEHRDPIALFGFILMLESLAVRKGAEIQKKISEIYGSEAANFIRVHAAEDPSHTDEALQLVASLNAREQRVILSNLLSSARYYCAILARIQTLDRNGSLAFVDTEGDPLSASWADHFAIM